MCKRLGFSLLELLITLAILGILIAIIYPSYTTHIIKVRRSQAKIALLDLANKLEEYHIANNTYQGATLTELQEKNNLQFYHLEISSLTKNTFVISAVPIENQIKDSNCGALIFDQAGHKSITGSDDINDCW